MLRSKTVQVPELQRSEKAEPHRQRILDLFSNCKGNLVRVHEECWPRVRSYRMLRDRFLPAAWHRAGAGGSGRPV